ncbi:MAG: phenylalanine--tRNA ligase subunit alpha, partial [Candidatus Aegiribacteria sp.]|nr:phenylalanine--tRNA ligase subunit alpha [Candidatus Aegiribacteria sp.]
MTEERDLHPLEQQLLSYLSEHGASSDEDIVKNSELPDEGSYRRAVEWLLSRDLVTEESRTETSFVSLGPVGESNLEKGTTPELAMLRKIAEGAASLQEIQEDPIFDKGRWGSAFGALMRWGLVKKDSEGIHLSEDPESTVFRSIWDNVYSPLSEQDELELSGIPTDVAEVVKERSPKRGKSKAEFTSRTRVTRVVGITAEGEEALRRSGSRSTIGAITPGVLSKGAWKEADFRRYQLDIPPARIHTGRLHPYRQFLDTVRKRFVALGFQEMEGSIAENEFWNNDALFMPQFHPARDIHDVYYLEDTARIPPPSEEILKRVAETHENGRDTGGRGWGYSFSREQSLLAILRSQGTALSARTLASSPDIPGKYFGIARCFRYDQVDSTHLPDFFQIEGIVLGE